MPRAFKPCLKESDPLTNLRDPRGGMAALKGMPDSDFFARPTSNFGTNSLRAGRSGQRYFDRFPAPKRGTLDSGFHKGQSFNPVFDSRECTIDLV